MAAFSSFCDNSASLLNSPTTINDILAFLEEPFTDFQQFYQPESSSILNLDHSTNVSALSNNETFVFSVTNNNTMDSSSIVTGYKYDDEKTTQKITVMDKKRKLKQGPFANSAQSKDMRQVRRKKQEEMKDGNVKKATDPTPTGYVHVRARRGQATNSHSLAERVRREKISKRMKLLQALVPGCDKLTGKALVLDEIINYVQSLQNQVEFLSMKIASTIQTSNDFGMESDAYMNLSNLGSPLLAIQQINSSRTANDYLLLDNSANSILFQSSQIPSHLPSGNRQVAWIEEDQRQML